MLWGPDNPAVPRSDHATFALDLAVLVQLFDDQTFDAHPLRPDLLDSQLRRRAGPHHRLDWLRSDGRAGEEPAPEGATAVRPGRGGSALQVRLCHVADLTLGQPAEGARQADGGPAEPLVVELPQVAHPRAVCRSLRSQPERYQQDHNVAESAGVHRNQRRWGPQFDYLQRDGYANRSRVPDPTSPLQHRRRRAFFQRNAGEDSGGMVGRGNRRARAKQLSLESDGRQKPIAPE